MAKFRKKPIVIEAEQYSRERELADGYVPEGVTRCPRSEDGGEGGMPFVITAHHQPVTLEDGDWITAEPNGDGYYPIKPDIFEATYEPVGEGTAT